MYIASLMIMIAAQAPANAADVSPPLQSAVPADAHGASVPDTAEPSASEPVQIEELATLRGGQSIVIGNQTLSALTSGNVINGDYAAGAVSLGDNALANFNGLGNLAINTGAQVSLQAGMNVVINVRD